MRDDVEQAADFGLETKPFLGHCCFTFGISLASESGWVRKLCQICEMPRKAATLSDRAESWLRLVVLRHLKIDGASRITALAMQHPKPNALTMSAVSSGVASQHQGRITAVLGPTNTGKTYLAIERMLGHRSGMIGFPLRLLARENYDKIVKAKGRRAVALVTGEEKIIPPRAVYFVCTVESMPLDRPVAFLAVDEIQLCADPGARPYLHRAAAACARHGRDHVSGRRHDQAADPAAGARCRVHQPAAFLVPDLYRPQEADAAAAALSAVVAFSATDVYTIAELIRRQRGGTAVVLGALSPRTRNAQVALYQAGEVDYLVATDAIGMGLNMDVDHVAFAKLNKFDGRAPAPAAPRPRSPRSRDAPAAT